MGILGKSPWSNAHSDSLPRKEFLIASQNCRNSKTAMCRAPWVNWQVTGCLWILPRTEGPAFCPFSLLTSVLTHSWRFLAVKGAAPFLTLGCCAKLCVFSCFRILPHKSARLAPSLWEQRFSASPAARLLVSGSGSWDWEMTRGNLDQRASVLLLHIPEWS